MSTKKHDVPEALLASLLADYQKPEDLIGENGPLKQLTKGKQVFRELINHVYDFSGAMSSQEIARRLFDSLPSLHYICQIVFDYILN